MSRISFLNTTNLKTSTYTYLRRSSLFIFPVSGSLARIACSLPVISEILIYYSLYISPNVLLVDSPFSAIDHLWPEAPFCCWLLPWRGNLEEQEPL